MERLKIIDDRLNEAGLEYRHSPEHDSISRNINAIKDAFKNMGDVDKIAEELKERQRMEAEARENVADGGPIEDVNEFAREVADKIKRFPPATEGEIIIKIATYLFEDTQEIISHYNRRLAKWNNIAEQLRSIALADQ